MAAYYSLDPSLLAHTKLLAMANYFRRWLLRVPMWLSVAELARGSTGPLASADGVYDSSITPVNLPWNTYNYCNAPHVNAEHYQRPTNAPHAKLVYLNVVTRHHKVGLPSARAACRSAE